MPAQLDFPQRFTTSDPEALRRELERLAQSLDLYTRGAIESFAPRYLAIPTVNPPILAFGFVSRVELADGATLNLQLPPADRKNYGKRCAILRRTTTGIVRALASGGALVAGRRGYQMTNDLHFVEFLLDDGNYYPSHQGVYFE